IAATNTPLKEAVKAGKFREDLFFRLHVIEIAMPPLRDRRDDIGLLARYFVQKHAQRCGRRVSGLTPSAVEVLVGYDWPGNVRELENAIERAIALGVTDEVQPEDLPDDVLEGSPTTRPSALRQSLKSTKVEAIRKSLEQARGSYTEAARILGIHVNALHRMIRKLDLLQDVRAMRARLSLSDTDD